MRAPTIFTSARWASAGSAALFGLAMLLYPGGTLRDPTTRGYQFFHNFGSDLVNTVTFGGQPNYPSLVLAVGGAALLAAAFGGCCLGFVRLYSSWRNGRLVHAAAAAGMLACAANIAAAVSPGNRALTRHIWFGYSGFLAEAVASSLFAVATARDDRFTKGVPIAWTAAAGAIAVLVGVAHWGPPATSDDGLVIHVVTQKIVLGTLWAIFLYQTVQADRVARTIRVCQSAGSRR